MWLLLSFFGRSKWRGEGFDHSWLNSWIMEHQTLQWQPLIPGRQNFVPSIYFSFSVSLLCCWGCSNFQGMENCFIFHLQVCVSGCWTKLQHIFRVNEFLDRNHYSKLFFSFSPLFFILTLFGGICYCWQKRDSEWEREREIMLKFKFGIESICCYCCPRTRECSLNDLSH